MLTLLELQRRHTALCDEASALLDAAGDETSLTDTALARLTEVRTQVAALDTQIEHRDFFDKRARSAPGRPLDGPTSTQQLRVFEGGLSERGTFDGTLLRAQNGELVPVLEARHKLADFLPKTDSPARELGLGRFLRAVWTGPQTELERRVLGEAAIGTGGATVPTPLAAEIIDLMRPRTAAFQAGAVTVPMTSQTLRYARVIADPVGGYRNENAPIVEDEPAFDDVPMTARSWALLTKMSRELLEDAQNLDSTLSNVFAQAAGLALDNAIIFGSGVAPSPRGIVNTAGIGVIDMGATAGAALDSYDPLLDLMLATDMANAPGVTAMVMSPRTSRALDGLTDTIGQPLAMPARLAAIPRLRTTSVPIDETHGTATAASSIVSGYWPSVYVGMRTALTISVLTERFAEFGQVGFVLWMRNDVLLTHPPVMAKLVGITP